jgi:hypothetical protein
MDLNSGFPAMKKRPLRWGGWVKVLCILWRKRHHIERMCRHWHKYEYQKASVKLTLIAKNLEFLTFYYKFILLIEILKFQGNTQKK